MHAAKETLQVKVDEVKQRLHRSSETLRDKADEATSQAKGLTDQAVAKFGVGAYPPRCCSCPAWVCW